MSLITRGGLHGLESTAADGLIAFFFLVSHRDARQTNSTYVAQWCFSLGVVSPAETETGLLGERACNKKEQSGLTGCVSLGPRRLPGRYGMSERERVLHRR